MSSVIHQEVSLSASPDRVFRAFMDSGEHSAFTGGPATLSAEAGGAFSAHGGAVQGRNVELVPGRRIVQAWRIADWAEGVYSILRLELQPEGDGTRLVMDHEGVPAEKREAITAGWQMRYWEPLARHLSA